MDEDILALLPAIENFGNLWPFAVGFMEISLSVFELLHFEKKCAIDMFSALGKTHFGQVVTKPIAPMTELMGIKGRDNINNIFHSPPNFLNCMACEAKVTS